MGSTHLAIKNLLRKPGRTAALILLTALLAASVFGGSVVLGSLRSGLGSLEARLGADIRTHPCWKRCAAHRAWKSPRRRPSWPR